MKRKIMSATNATNATRPTVSPTAAPVPSPLDFFLFFRDADEVSLEEGGVVGVTNTVITLPVTVYTEATAVGVHVDDVESSVDELPLEDVVVA